MADLDLSTSSTTGPSVIPGITSATATSDDEDINLIDAVRRLPVTRAHGGKAIDRVPTTGRRRWRAAHNPLSVQDHSRRQSDRLLVGIDNGSSSTRRPPSKQIPGACERVCRQRGRNISRYRLSRIRTATDKVRLKSHRVRIGAPSGMESHIGGRGWSVRKGHRCAGITIVTSLRCRPLNKCVPLSGRRGGGGYAPTGHKGARRN